MIDIVRFNTRFTVNRYWKNIEVNKAKGLWFPEIRGTWLPCYDQQCMGGGALNWLGLRTQCVPYKELK